MLPFSRPLLLAALALGLAAPAFAQNGDKSDKDGIVQKDPIPADKIPPSPMLSPAEEIRQMVVEKGFVVEAALTEPAIELPVCAQFDEAGRLWVVEMRTYMPTLDGHGEEEPKNLISVHTDTNNDGTYDKTDIFLDGLVMPRALAIFADGILMIETPKLVWVKRDGLKAGERTVISENFAVGGNVEHLPNGLLRNLDGWIYNAKCDQRLRRRPNGTWQIEKTEFRGQWGIARDDYGHLFYNNNSRLLQGDDLAPGAGPAFKDAAALYGKNLAAGNSIWPARVNPGVNRAYDGKTLGKDGKLSSPTAAAGLVIYRGANFPADCYGDAFIATPCGNLVKRLKLGDSEGILNAAQPFTGREFIASKSERFRPVNMLEGPDGCLYIVDMSVGPLQHKTYMTSYLRKQYAGRGLDKPAHQGRIWRVRFEGNPRGPLPPLANATGEALVSQLKAKSGWTRDMAQNLLRDKPWDDATTAALNKLALDDAAPLARVLALHTLASTGKLTPAAVAAAETSADARVRSHALRAASDSVPANSFPAKDLMDLLAKAAADKSPEVTRQILRSLSAVFAQEPARAAELAVKLAGAPKADKSYAVLAVSASAGQEKALVAAAGKSPLATLAEGSQKAREKTSAKVTVPAAAQAVMEAGHTAFMVNCSGCHGLEGQGMPNMAPPLADSDYVDGAAKRLVHIALDGLEGPVTVSGKKYAPPEVLPNMPGFRANPALDDQTLANLLTYLRYSWGHKAGQVTAEEVAAIRQGTASRTKAWTEAELHQETAVKKVKN